MKESSFNIYEQERKFLNNKYAQWYFSIVSSRKLVPPSEGYSERHHIVPRKLGGSNDKQNLVRLSAREHFVCHRLLTKMVTGKDRLSMLFAAYALAWYRASNRDPVKVNSRTYEVLKKELSDARKTIPGANKGKTWTPEQRASMKNKTNGTAIFHKGRKRSDETRSKIREKRAFQVIKKKTWTLKDPSGNIIETQGLKTFCIEHRLGLSKLLLTEQTKLPVETGFSKGWMIVSIIRS